MGVCLDKDLQSKTAGRGGDDGVDGQDVDVVTNNTAKLDGGQKEEQMAVKSRPLSLGGFVGKSSRKRRALKMAKNIEDDKKGNENGEVEVITSEEGVGTAAQPPPPPPLVNTECTNGDVHCGDNLDNETRENDVVDSVQVSTVDLNEIRPKSDTYSVTTMPHLPELTQPAPEFAGPAVVDGVFKDIKLSDYKGKYLVLFFYPLDFTFVCPTEIISFSDKVSEFKAINCEVIACSTDSQYSHFAWVNTSRKQGGLGALNIPLLADKTGKIARDYGCYKEDEGIAFRGLYIIDDKGRLRQITINDLPVGRSVEETLRLVQAFQFTDKHGEVCPANWKPGDKTMKPDPKASKEYFEQKH